ncbi:hypothetical protein GGX14DRAFT_638571 [Mycena pura]|uniref:DNA recombination and repair protein Rad51-like C-terminal domain-containing protein n=1 Tax=Mycena pura TaxID=153505 RepID=A0AAD6YP21_9AGAR|nr:hypothetical protein GGX14DRAFT_638571 [Mycena pura]
MLQAIPSESLFSFLTTVRTAALPPDPALQLGPLCWGDVFEIQGSSGSGKSQLVYAMLATCIMPLSHNSAALGGWGKAAVLFDTDGTFDARQFRENFLLHLVRAFSRSNAFPDDAQLLAIAAEALQRLHVIRPASSAQLAASIHHLPVYHKKHMADADIALVAVDSLSAFYWPDRFAAEQPHTHSIPNNSTPLHHVLTALQAFRISHRPITILTNWGLALANTAESSVDPLTAYKQHLPSFPSFPPITATHNLPFDMPSSILPLTHHITLFLAPIPPFHGDASFINRGQGEVIGYIRKPGSSQVVRFAVDILSNDGL